MSLTSLSLSITLALTALPFSDPGSPASDASAPAHDRAVAVRETAGLEPLLLDFHSERCGPCLQMRPNIAALEAKNYPIRSIDVARRPETAAKYGVERVPTFVVVDPDTGEELTRTEGYQPAGDLARFYLAAKRDWLRDRANRDRDRDADRFEDERGAAPPPSPSPSPSFRTIADRAGDRDRGFGRDAGPSELDFGASPNRSGLPIEREIREQGALYAPENPFPWETVVRIKIHIPNAVVNGSGTVIYSNGEEALILTCAHIFEVEKNNRAKPTPERYPYPITVDLFDGQLHGKTRQQVHMVESLKGEVLDFDFARDVGLMKIRPNRKIPAARLVPPEWRPRPGTEMITVGCSEGADATAWSTEILPTRMNFQVNPAYEGMVCRFAPKQGRSGGGIFTRDGYYLAGVCNFQEPIGQVGLYAVPDSVYKLLDRNQLAALYQQPSAPADGRGRTMLASDDDAGARPRARFARGNDSDDGARIVPIPPPEMLGIAPPRRGYAREVDAEGFPIAESPAGAGAGAAANSGGRTRLASNARGESIDDGWRAHDPEPSVNPAPRVPGGGAGGGARGRSAVATDLEFDRASDPFFDRERERERDFESNGNPPRRGVRKPIADDFASDPDADANERPADDDWRPSTRPWSAAPSW